ncbi:MAG: gliding motility-associated C-terminal domain-containing protein [Bacteroidia bacterium]
MKGFYFLLLVGLMVGCTKSKIDNNCKNNKVEISPSKYNQDSAAIYMATAFSPNGDLLNDEFKAMIYGLDLKEFKVFKRNKELFSTRSRETGWDGTDKDGNLCKDGVYSYTITANNETDGHFEIKGEVSLITKDKNKSCDCRYEDQIDPAMGFVSTTSETCDGN